MRFAIFTTIAALMLAACDAAEDHPKAGSDEACAATTLQHLVGTSRSIADLGALPEPKRLLPPGSMMTLDHNPDRLNISWNEAGLITRIWCG